MAMRFKAGTPTRLLAAAAALAALTGLGCGSSSDDGPTMTEAAAPSAKDFPAVNSRTLEELAGQEATEGDLVVSPAGQVFREGENRVGFGVFSIDRKPILDADVALYVAKPNQPALGPFPAAVEPLNVSAAFQSKGTSTDPDAAEVVYASDVDLDSKGEWRMLALIREGDEFTYSVAPSAVVGQFDNVPAAGEKAPVISTPTAEDVGGDLTKIDTRQPPSTLHDVDFEDVVGEKPVVLLFATPALCQSRVCGPVVDITEEVKAQRPDDAAYIMMEIYKDNVIGENSLRPQVKAYSLPSEPWLFVVNTDGTISTEIEGAFSAGELNAAIDKAS